MRPLHQQLADATRLTRNGDLTGAVASIQAVLAGGRPTAKPHSENTAPANPDIVLGSFRKFDIAKARRLPLLLDHASNAEVLDPQERVEPSAVPPRGQFLRGQYANQAGARDYRLFVPPTEPGKLLSLVVMLHGCTQDPDAFAAGTAMNEIALTRGFMVLYPAQTQSANANRCWNWFERAHQQRDAGEPAILAGMTRHVMNHYGIDPQRIYVAGLSAGGAMAVVLGETYPDLYAAVGVHSGLPSGVAHDLPSAFAAMKSGQASSAMAGLRKKTINRAERPPSSVPRNAPPTIVFHGDQDKTVGVKNGDQIVAACMRSAAGFTDAPSSQSRTERGRCNNGREYTRTSHYNADGHPISELWTIHGAGHAWSGGRKEGSYTDPRGPNASEEMIRFFYLQQRPV
ncbi:MAG: PHB depolymerase family esterase [Lysobacteraceae bacterium]